MSTPSWFSRRLLPWYRANQRPLPWRADRDPYRIWLSEVILQQTRVDQGLGYWLRFTGRWPTVQALAKAEEADVLKLWQGLGYYSRARNLLTAAKQVVHAHGGTFPANHAELVHLKGVGDYTAAAIASICFGRPEAVVDGNVYRVLARFAGIATPIDSTEGRKRFKGLATGLLDPAQPGDHNQAVMELGATVCTPRNARCHQCPLKARCVAFATGRTEDLPVKTGKTKTRDRYFNYLHIATPGGLYMQQRGPGDIWQGLYELPLLESGKTVTKPALARLLENTHGKGWSVHGRHVRPRHVLSHQVIHAVCWTVSAPKGFTTPNAWVCVGPGTLAGLPVPRLIEQWLAEAVTA